MAEKKIKIYSEREYLTLENSANFKSEFEDGHIVAMSGGTLNHGIIGNNINTALNNGLRTNNLGCIPINGDVRIYIENANSFVYPDAMVISGDIESYKGDEHSVVNPVLIIEVLSKSTESYDRGGKFHKYCSLPSFKEYVLIDQYRPIIDVLYRENSRYWKMSTTIGLDKSIFLNTIQCEIKLSEIYNNTQGLLPPQFKLNV